MIFINFFYSHGLSYTTFGLSELHLSKPVVSSQEFSIAVSVTITNTGKLAGSQVIQIYVTLPPSDVTHPPLQLKGFAKVYDLQPGNNELVEITLDKYAVSYWDDRWNAWVVGHGEYVVRVGTSSEDLPLQSRFVIAKGFEWQGL